MSKSTQTATSRSSKMAALVADQIVGDIAERGWPEGTVVDSEAGLLARYGVSRAVLREAVRLLEHMHVVRMRRGPGGGLMVLAPTVDSVTDAVAVYLLYTGAEIDEVFDARLVLEEMAAELATERFDDRQAGQLRALVTRELDGEPRDHRELHNLVAAVTGNPALAFLVDLLNRVTLLYLPPGTTLPPGTLAESARAHAAIVDAVLAGDGGRARGRMRKHLHAEAEFLRSRRPSRRRLADLSEVVGRSDKRAEQIARRIFHQVASDGWPVGAYLGSEADLMARHGASRAVLREAVRVLEHHQVARMRRGPGGGLFVIEPGVEAVTDAVALQVDRLGIQPKDLLEVRTAVEMVVLGLVADRREHDAAARLEAALDAEQAATSEELAVVGHDLHAVLAGATGNRVIELLVRVLLRLTRFHAAAGPPRAPVPARDAVPARDVMDTHRLIVDALLAGDLDLARNRMGRHLDALARWVR